MFQLRGKRDNIRYSRGKNPCIQKRPEISQKPITCELLSCGVNCVQKCFKEAANDPALQYTKFRHDRQFEENEQNSSVRLNIFFLRHFFDGKYQKVSQNFALIYYNYV